MDKEILKKGTRIYYTGDQANEEGLGAITHRSTGRYGVFVTVLLDDGRRFESLSAADFSDTYKGDYSSRFVTEEAYTDFRQAEIDKVEAALAERDAERSTEPKPVKANQLKLGDVLKNGTGAILLAKREDFHNGLFFMVLCLVPSKSEFVTWGMNEDGVTFDGRYFFNISEAALDFDKR